jgi:hypothetical protein
MQCWLAAGCFEDMVLNLWVLLRLADGRPCARRCTN